MEALQSYEGLLSEIENTTSKLLLAIGSWNTDEVDRLLETRTDQCNKIGPFANISDSNIPEATVKQLKAKHESLIKQQAECESALSAGLEKCKADLLSLNQRRDLRDAYREPTDVRQARFLDSRL